MNWNCFTGRERHRCLGYSIVIVTFLICSVLVYTSLKYTERDTRRRSTLSEKLADKECSPTCFTKECVLHANLLNEHMEPIFNPCEDFYSFTCGSFGKKLDKDDNLTYYGMTNKRILMELKDLLDNLEADPKSASGKMKIVYDSCMNTRSSELSAFTSALEFFENLGFPNWADMPPNFEFTKPKLSTVLGTLEAYREGVFFQISNYQVDGNYVFDTSVGTKSFNPKSYLDIPNKETRILKYFNLDKKDVKKSIQSIFTPLNSLKSRYKTCELENSTDFHINCSQEVPDQWRMLCEIVETFIDVANVSHKMSKNSIYVPCSDVEEIETIFNLTTKIPHSAFVDLFMMKFFSKHMDDLNFYFRLIKKDDRTPLNVPYADPRLFNHWEHCVEWVTNNMVFASGREYIKDILSEQVLIEVQDVAEQNYREIKDLITSQNWLTSEDKELLVGQIDNTPILTKSMLEYYLNETFVNNFYSQFHPTPDSYMKNVMERQRAYFTTDLILERDYRLLTDHQPFLINAFYRWDSIELGFGFMKYPAFIPGGLRFLNLARFAFPIGHELGHVFDSNEWKKNWLTEVKYQQRATCLYKQFSNFTIETLDQNVNALMTASENLADSISVALLDKLVKEYRDEVEYYLPTLPFSTKELAYIIYAELKCEKTSKEMDQFKYDHDPHAHENFRITAVMQNSKYFSQTFNCTEGSYMNPKSKCSMLDLE